MPWLSTVTYKRPRGVLKALPPWAHLASKHIPRIFYIIIDGCSDHITRSGSVTYCYLIGSLGSIFDTLTLLLRSTSWPYIYWGSALSVTLYLSLSLIRPLPRCLAHHPWSLSHPRLRREIIQDVLDCKCTRLSRLLINSLPYLYLYSIIYFEMSYWQSQQTASIGNNHLTDSGLIFHQTVSLTRSVYVVKLD